MCGIFTVIDRNDSIKKLEVIDYVEKLIKDSAKRGRDAVGLLIFHKNKIELLKKSYDPLLFLKKKNHHQVINKIFNGQEVIEGPLLIMGQSRMATNGYSFLDRANQPIFSHGLWGLFNGIMISKYDGESWVRTEIGMNAKENDTHEFFRLKRNFKNNELFQKIEGNINYISFNPEKSELELGTNTGSLYKHELKNLEFYTSEKKSSLFNSVGKQLGKNKIHQIQMKDKLNNGKIEIIGDSKFDNLKRCSNCVLPHTHPFIYFDKNGVCNYCLNYQRQKYLGKDLLEKRLEQYRSKSNELDCIVGLSGGRDSCYGLHLLKTEFGMNPVAYTYDWGLTTDISRRNQSIMCSKLGVEHIIRSANLEQKRRFVRKNVNAWMKSPHLGMIPLFMAGDKEFFEYGRTLRKELNIDLTVMSSGHQLEQREFMVGFTGLKQPVLHNNPDFFHHPQLLKVKLALWYALQFVKNPRYLNESLMDSFNSYIISFFKSTGDFIYLFRYIPWEEEKIEKTLREKYGWESDTLYGQNQWRMGDGQTAFNNFIYYHIAGITEYDSFRSHQVREEILSREQAIKLLREDNKPKYEVIKTFCETIGLPFEETIKSVLKITPIF